MIYIVIIGVLLGVILRILPLLMYRRDTSDAWDEILFAKEIKKAGKIPELERNVYPPQEWSYPAGSAYIVSFFLKHKDPIFTYSIFNIAIDTIGMLALSCFVYFFANSCELDSNQILNAIVFSVYLYALMPVIYSPWAGMYSVSGRPIGAVLSNIILMATVVSLSNIYISLIVVILFPISLFFSKFSHQALILGMLSIALIEKTMAPIWLYFFSLLFSLVITRGYLLTVIRGHIKFTQFYVSVLSKVHQNIHANNIGLFKAIKLLCIGKLNMINLIKVPILRINAFYPFYFLSICLGGWLVLSGNQYSDLEVLFNLSIIAFFLIFIINTKPLKFLGEADRYVSYIGIMAAIIILSIFLAQSPYGFMLFVMIAVISVLISTVFLKTLRKQTSVIPENAFVSVCEWLNKTDADNTKKMLIANPFNMANRFLLNDASNEYFTLLSNAPMQKDNYDILAKFIKRSSYPIIDISEKELMDFGITHLIVSKKHINAEYLGKLNITINQWWDSYEPNYENSYFKVFKLKKRLVA